MSDLLNIIMEDPTIKEEIVLRAKKAIKDIVFTKSDITKVRTAMIDAIVNISSFSEDDIGDNYFEIQDLIVKKIRKILINKFSDTK